MFLTCEYCGKEFHGVEAFEEAFEHEKNCPAALKETLYDLISDANDLLEEKNGYLSDIEELDAKIAKTHNKAVDVARKAGYSLDVDDNGWLYVKNKLKNADFDKVIKDFNPDCRQCDGVCGEQNCCDDCVLTEGWDDDGDSDDDEDDWNPIDTSSNSVVKKEGYTASLKDGKFNFRKLSNEELNEILGNAKIQNLDDVVKEFAKGFKENDFLSEIKNSWKEILGEGK